MLGCCERGMGLIARGAAVETLAQTMGRKRTPLTLQIGRIVTEL
jgi:hypothetical protein